MLEGGTIEVKEPRVPADMDGTLKDALEAFNRLHESLRAFPKPPVDVRADKSLLKLLAAQIREAQAQARAVLAKLQKLVPLLQAEAARCKANMDALLRDRGGLHVPGTVTLYSEAFFKQKKEYESVVNQRDRAEDLVKSLTGIIQESCSKQYGV